MLKETTLMVQTYDLKVDINCNGCVKKIEKIMRRIDGVYKTNVNRQQGKVTVTGQMDISTVLKKFKKASMSAQLWDANSAVVNKDQKLQLGGTDRGDQLKDAGDKGLPQGEAIINGGSGARSNGGTNDARIVLPQLTPTPEQNVANIQQHIEQRLRMLNGEKLPPQPMGMPPANSGVMQSGKKIGGGTNVLVTGNPNNDNKSGMGTKLYQDAGGNQVKNGTIGQPPHNGALGSLNINHGQAKKDISVGVGRQMSGSMVPPKGGMMRPTGNMIGPTSFPTVGQMGAMSKGPYNHLDGNSMQPYGGSAIHGLGMHTSSLPREGFYPSGGSSGTEMMQQVARNPMPQQSYMMVQPQPEHGMMMNAHFPHSQNAHYGPGYTGYQKLMGYDNGHGHQQQQYPPPMCYPMPLLPQHENIFNDEYPNICSLM